MCFVRVKYDLRHINRTTSVIKSRTRKTQNGTGKRKGLEGSGKRGEKVRLLCTIRRGERVRELQEERTKGF